MKVSDPDGRTWRVSRRWLPLRSRSRRRRSDPDRRDGSGGGSGGDSGGWDIGAPEADDLVGLALGVGLLVVLAVVAPLLLPLLELVVLVLLLPFAVLGRVLLGRRWTIEVRRGWRPVHYELTGTWSEAGARITELAVALERGHGPRGEPHR